MTVGFGLLGEIEAWVNGQPVNVGHVRQRSVLAALLVDANRSVSAERLVDRVWGERPPSRAYGTLYGYLSHLRKVLTRSAGVEILRNAAGYVLAVDPDVVDLHRFRRLISQAGKAVDDQQRLTLYEQALALWRSEPFGRLDNPWFNGLRDNLEKERLVVELERNDILLRAGQHRRLLPELTDRAAAHPLDERIAQQLILALYRSDRQAQALQHYEAIRRQLAEELGTRPGTALQRLHRQILTADPGLRVPAARGDGLPPVPRQLPAPPRGFVGRAAELAELADRLPAGDAHGMSVPTISGTGGVGKTWLALRWAHDHVEHFPDGQLYVNLHGFDANTPPVAPADAIRTFLDAMGVDLRSAPSTLDGQTGLFRSLVAGKRMLILLDNARDAAQVEPLLPGTPSSTVLITSRNRLAGLTITYGARPLLLDLLTETQAWNLLTHHLGASRVAAEPNAAAELLATCGGLPLALAIVTARATTYPTLPLGALAEELRDATARLDDDDPAVGPRAAFSASYAALSPEQATALALLGIAPGPEIGLPALASLIGVGASDARGLLRGLEELSLVQQDVAGRFRLHDLVRPYAAERAEHDLDPDVRNAALRRLLDCYLHTAHAADRLLQPHSPTFQLDPPMPGYVPSPMSGQADAMAWFKLEHRSLLAIQAVAADHGWDLQVWRLARVLSHFHHWRAIAKDDLTAWQAALDAATRLDDKPLQADACRRLGMAYSRMGERPQAFDHIQRAIDLFSAAGDTYGRAHSFQTLAVMCERIGDTRAAVEHCLEALPLFRAAGDIQGEAGTLNMIGWYYAHVGEPEKGRPYCEQALLRHEEYGDEFGLACTLDSLGYIAYHTASYAEAVHYHARSLVLTRKLGNASLEGMILTHLGDAHHALGEHAEARRAWQDAADIFRGQGRDAEADAVIARLDSPG